MESSRTVVDYGPVLIFLPCEDRHAMRVSAVLREAGLFDAGRFITDLATGQPAEKYIMQDMLAGPGTREAPTALCPASARAPRSQAKTLFHMTSGQENGQPRISAATEGHAKIVRADMGRLNLQIRQCRFIQREENR